MDYTWKKDFDQITGCWIVNTRINGKLFTAYFATELDADNYINQYHKINGK